MAKSKKAVNIIEGIIIGILILIIAGMLFLYFTFSKTGAAPEIFGYTIYHTMAVNMAPEIPADTAVIAKSSENENIKVGSAVLCRIGDDTVLTRVVQLLNENGEKSYVVKFDTAPANDTFKIPAENIIAKAVWQSAILGKMLSFATSTFGIMIIIIIPSFIIIVFQIVRIINVKRREEESVSLDELENIMDDDGERFSVESYEESPEPKPMVFKNEEPEKEEKPSVLSVDKNGKGSFGVSESGSKIPLYTYDSLNTPKVNTSSEKSGGSVVKPIHTPNTDNFYSSFVSDSERDPLYGGRIKPQQVVAESEEEAPRKLFTQQQEDAKKEPSESNASFMSNVIPEKIVNTAAAAEKAATKPADDEIKPAAPAVQEKKENIAPDKTIPAKAVVPKEKLAPPVKRNNSKAISDLMNIIDTEKSKLNK